MRSCKADLTIFDDWDAADDLPDHPTSLPGILADPALFPSLSAHAKDIVINVMVQQAVHEPVLLALLNDLRTEDLLLERHVRAIEDVIASSPLSRLADSGLPLKLWVERVIERLKIKTWDTQNAAIAALRVPGREAVIDLSEAQQEALGRNLTQAADGSAYSATNLLGEVSQGSEMWPKGFVKGIVLEAFAHEEGALRLKTAQLSRVLRSLRAVDGDGREELIDATVAALRSGQPRDGYFFARERPEAVKIDSEVETEEGLSGLAAVKEALEQVEVEQELGP